MELNEQENLIQVGKVKDAHGLKGELYILLFAKEATWLKKLKKYNLSHENAFGKIERMTLTIKSTRVHKDGLLVVSPEVTDRTQAEKLKNYAFEIPKNLLVSAKGETPYLIELLGFEVFDQGQRLGTIHSFATNSFQDLLVVESETHYYEIPYVEAFVEKTDFKLRKILMHVPEGLLELCQRPKDTTR
jgi:16S rRNA processing protein RimM